MSDRITFGVQHPEAAALLTGSDWVHIACQETRILDETWHAGRYAPNPHEEPVVWRYARHPLQTSRGVDRWHTVLACLLLTRTSRVRAEPVFHRLVMAGGPCAVAALERTTLARQLRPLGLVKRRPRWVRLAAEFFCDARHHDWVDRPIEEIASLPGVGPYALDALRLFHGDWADPDWRPDDAVLLRALALRWFYAGAYRIRG